MTQPDSFAVVCMGGTSNTRCAGASDGSVPERTLEQVEADVLDAQRLAARSILLVGGEPLIRKDLPSILRTLREHHMVPAVATNGRMLVYKKVRQLVLRARVQYLRIELHGSSPRVHDSIVDVPGAFDQTFEGLRNLLMDGPRCLHIDVACTVLSQNLQHLNGWVDTVTSLPRRTRLSLRLVAPRVVTAPQGWASAKEVSLRVNDALHRIRRAGTDLGVAWEGFAPCMLEAHSNARDEVVRCGSPVLGAPKASASIPLEQQGDREHPFPCQECAFEFRCPGTPKQFLLHHGEAALQPKRRLQANSFNYEYVRQVRPFQLDPANCTARTVDLPRGTTRSLLLVQNDTASLYESSTSDFSDRQIAQVKDEFEQVYMDTHQRATLDDFANGLRRVHFDPQCASCPNRSTCCGAGHVDTEPPFGPEERWLAGEVSNLRGRVLDVGCGDLLYRDEMGLAVALGNVEYHGLDPDASALTRLRQLGMTGTLHQGEIETSAFEPGYFDSVLVLRSLNHFRDMTQAFRTISRVLRIHGTLLLCDSPPFAMLRTPKQVAYADTNAPRGHEHYRNWTSQQVVEFLRRFPFRVNVHRPVTRHTSAQWMIMATRINESPIGCCGAGVER